MAAVRHIGNKNRHYSAAVRVKDISTKIGMLIDFSIPATLYNGGCEFRKIQDGGRCYNFAYSMTIAINALGQSRIVDESRSWNKAHVYSDSFLLVVNSNHGSVSSLSSSADRMHDSELTSSESK